MDAWLVTRRPPPPSDLGEALRFGNAGPMRVESLTEAGLSRLNQARSRPGRVRDSAFRLLEADALLTYACEAALESDEPVAALHRILSVTGG